MSQEENTGVRECCEKKIGGDCSRAVLGNLDICLCVPFFVFSIIFHHQGLVTPLMIISEAIH